MMYNEKCQGGPPNLFFKYDTGKFNTIFESEY